MMNKKEILRKAGGILTELNEQYEYLSRSPENLSELELELFSANANFLSDHLAILVKLNSRSSKPVVAAERPDDQAADQKSEPSVNTQQPSGQDDQPTKESVSSDWKFELEKEPGITFDFEEKQADKLFDRPLTEEERRVIEEKTRLKSVPDSEPEEIQKEEAAKDDPVDNDAPEKNEQTGEGAAGSEPEDKDKLQNQEKIDPDDQPAEEDQSGDDAAAGVHVKEVVIAERSIVIPSDQIPEENPAPTVNDLLSRNISQQTVGSQFTSRQTKDLKGMISLNDKLLFVRDLFNGYSLAYSEAIELINRFDSFEAADNFLKQNYATKNNWSAKQDVTDKFYEVLNRRFIK